MSDISNYLGAIAHLGRFRDHMQSFERETGLLMDRSRAEIETLQDEVAGLRRELDELRGDVARIHERDAALENAFRDSSSAAWTADGQTPPPSLDAADFIRSLVNSLVSTPVSLRELTKRVATLDGGARLE